MLDELLTDPQRTKLRKVLRGSNVRDGAATVELEDIKELGPGKFFYLVRDGKPLERPSVMVVRVSLSGKALERDPMLLRKHLPPEGADHTAKLIGEGKRVGKRLQSVEITRMFVDIVNGREPAQRAAVAEFKKDITRYCVNGEPLSPQDWPERFRKPDGTFDLELTPVGVIWRVRRK